MTKQEQNEKIVYGSLITSTKCYNCIHFPLCFAQKGVANLELASENDCCYYQSKIPEGSVVLSREEYERITKELVTEQRATEIAKEYFEKMRKETVREILNAVDNESNGQTISITNYLRKKYGVEIEEWKKK